MSDDFAAFEIIEGDSSNGLILLCDHARNAVPDEYGTLGLPESEFERHIAYDIGAEALTRMLGERLGATIVQSCFSRLLIDPNRGEDDPTIVMRLSDGTIVPGNHPIKAGEIHHRIDRFHAPYHAAITRVIDAAIDDGNPPILFSVHSFTPVWKEIPRPWHGAFLWDLDPRLSEFMIEGLRLEPGLIIGDNEPYDGAQRNDTMYRHGSMRGLSHTLIEVRNDLIAEPAGVVAWADRLAPLLEEADARPDMHEVIHYGSRADLLAGTRESI